jgi:hypothetical protein
MRCSGAGSFGHVLFIGAAKILPLYKFVET